MQLSSSVLLQAWFRDHQSALQFAPVSGSRAASELTLFSVSHCQNKKTLNWCHALGAISSTFQIPSAGAKAFPKYFLTKKQSISKLIQCIKQFWIALHEYLAANFHVLQGEEKETYLACADMLLRQVMQAEPHSQMEELQQLYLPAQCLVMHPCLHPQREPAQDAQDPSLPRLAEFALGTGCSHTQGPAALSPSCWYHLRVLKNA